MQVGNKPPVWRLAKKKIIEMAKWKCSHGHTGLEHYSCWLKHNPDDEKVGFLDIETTNLKADFGIILSYAIADDKSDKIYNRCITKNDLKTCLDAKVVASCVADMRKFDRVIGFYSTKFDIPFIRTRAIALGLDFPEYGELIHNDLYYAIRNKLCISSNRLENACRVVLGATEKTRIDADHWIKALMGDEKAIAYIVDHNIKDVRETKKLYHRMENFRSKTDTSV
uniref:Putative RNase_H superfamily protein n=1 Tax=viral metagenome TaxID=1070528 RepID=A0A6M3KEA0_9ZZZZ